MSKRTFECTECEGDCCPCTYTADVSEQLPMTCPFKHTETYCVSAIWVEIEDDLQGKRVHNAMEEKNIKGN